MDSTANITYKVTYWNYKAKAWKVRRFTTEEAATEFFNVRMARALKSAPALSNGYTSMVQALTPRMSSNKGTAQ